MAGDATSGLLVIIGTLTGALSVLGGHRLTKQREIAAEQRQDAKRLKYVKASLLADLATVAACARLIPGIVQSHKAANKELTEKTKERCSIAAPVQFSEWELIAVLPDDIVEQCVGLMRLLDSNNHDIARTGGPFGDDNWGRHISEQATEIAHQANAIIAKLRGAKAPPAQE